jgi:hypothetical protein
MTKAHKQTQSLLNAATVANAMAERYTFDAAGDYPESASMEDLTAMLLLASEILDGKYEQTDESIWSDGAGDSISIRCGDYHILSVWNGEDVLFIYQCEPDDEVSEVIGHDPIFSVAL